MAFRNIGKSAGCFLNAQKQPALGYMIQLKADCRANIETVCFQVAVKITVGQTRVLVFRAQFHIGIHRHFRAHTHAHAVYAAGTEKAAGRRFQIG